MISRFALFEVIKRMDVLVFDFLHKVTFHAIREVVMIHGAKFCVWDPHYF